MAMLRPTIRNLTPLAVAAPAAGLGFAAASCSDSNARCADDNTALGVAAALSGAVVGFAAGYLYPTGEGGRKIMILFGAPGAGKGTQAGIIETCLGIPQRDPPPLPHPLRLPAISIRAIPIERAPTPRNSEGVRDLGVGARGG